MSCPKSSLIVALLAVTDVYCDAVGVSRRSVSKRLLKRSSLLDDMATGDRDLATATLERALQYFSDNWPAGVAWPDAIDRPMPGVGESERAFAPDADDPDHAGQHAARAPRRHGNDAAAGFHHEAVS